MQTIGERLEDARKKRSVTIEQAAEATKIRAEYLASLEKDAGADIPLQTVYIRGFLKNYAKFLRIEPSRLIADFEAIRHAHTANEPSGSARAEKELIGRLELATPTPTHASLPDDNKEKSPADSSGNSDSLWSAFTAIFSGLPKWVMPTALGVVAVLILAGIIGGIASLGKSQAPVATEENAAATELSLKLTALKDVTVIARDAAANTTLYAGTLKKGEEVPLTNKGAIRLQYSDGTSLQIERDGRTSAAGTAGAGKRVIE